MEEIIGSLFISIMAVKFFWDFGLWVEKKIDRYEERKQYKIDQRSWIKFRNNLDRVYKGKLAIKEGKFVDLIEVDL